MEDPTWSDCRLVLGLSLTGWESTLKPQCQGYLGCTSPHEPELLRLERASESLEELGQGHSAGPPHPRVSD